MRDYRVEAEVLKDGSVTIKGLPFQPGNRVEVIIRSRGPMLPMNDPIPYPYNDIYVADRVILL